MSRFSHPHAPTHTDDAQHMRRRVVLISWSLSHLPGIGDETSLYSFDSHNVRRASFVRRGVGTRVNQTMGSNTQYRCIKERRVDAISRDMEDDVSSTMIVHVLLNVLSISGQARRWYPDVEKGEEKWHDGTQRSSASDERGDAYSSEGSIERR